MMFKRQSALRPRSQTKCLSAFVMLALLLISTPLTAAIIGSEQDAGTRQGSRLRNDDRILIWPQGILSENGPKDPSQANFATQCVSLYNRSRIDYFVPWKTDSEWQAFLAARTSGRLNSMHGTVDAGRCCAQQVVDICGVTIPSTPGLPPEQDTNLGQRSVAARYTPANPDDLEHYGAVLDVKSMQSSVILNNNLINYEVTYMCGQDGVWAKTREIGSCIPIDGACNSQYTSTPRSSMPAPSQWATQLCGPGSILHDDSGTGAGPFVTGTGPWTWQCDGTPGRQPAACRADYDGCNRSIIPARGFRRLPTDLSTLCLSGNSTINVAPLVGNGPWDWQCQKNDNGYVSSCHANYDPSTDGTCNPAITGTPQTVVPLRKTGLCIGSDGITPVDAVADANCNDVRCRWTCAGINGGNNTQCLATRQQTPGQCGPLAGTTPITRPADGDAGLCAQGTPTTVTGTGNGATWNWGCTGSPNPAVKACSAPNSNAAQNGVCGSASGGLYTAMTPPTLSGSELCAVGTPTPYVYTNLGGGAQTWTWSCDGVNGGNNSGQCTISYYPGYVGSGCGSANNGTFGSAPAGGALCPTGNVAGPVVPVSNPDGWAWTCDDALYPGSPVNCRARNTVQPIPGSCGPANGSLFNNVAVQPDGSQLCQNGGAPFDLDWPTNPNVVATVTWGCAGQNGGADTSDTACRGTYVPVVDGQCGVAQTWTPNDISIIQNAAANQLCQPAGRSLPSNITANYNTNNPALSTINWTCSAGSATGQVASCSAQYVPTPRNGVCAVLSNTSIVTQPADNLLCSVGTPYNWVPPVAGTGPGTATWSCTGVYGGQPASCSQTGIEIVNPTGQCGKANGSYVPDKPNFNLCAPGGGTASAVSGGATGPWDWTCGTAQVACHADPCTLCSGDLPGAFSNVPVGSMTTKTLNGTCVANGQPIWSANAALQIANDVPVTLAWSDDFNGPVSINYTPTAAPRNYCAPCYMKPTQLLPGLTGAAVQKVSGTCPPAITETRSILPGTGLSP